MFLIYSALFAFTFGAVIGSFLNVVIHRVPIGESVVTPPSHCPTCGNGISWYDNIPILSWVMLGGQCRNCKTSISPRYAAVEGVTGVLAALLWIKLVGPAYSRVDHWAMLDFKAILIPFFLYFAFVAVCIAIAFIDLEHLIIPHELAIPGILIGIGASFLLESLTNPVAQMEQWPPITPSVSIIGAVLGALSVIVIFVVYFVLRGVAGMGGGDVTLMAMAGAWLGWPAIIFIFFAASIQGLIAVGIANLFGIDDFLHAANEIFDEDEEGQEGEEESTKESAEEAPAGEDEAEEDSLEESSSDEDDADATADEGATTDATDASANEDAGEDEDSEDKDEESAEEAAEADTSDEDEDKDDAETASAEEDDSEGKAGKTVVEVIEEGEEEEGPLAIPFGPFIVLAALEHLYLGPLLPDSISMAYMYF
jgi:leader peptidase (prepilin peptidase)/N-methyltransferase